MRQHTPSQAQCTRLARKILLGVGVRRFSDLHRIVIHQGLIASGLDPVRFKRLQTAFHAVQGLRWAREEDRPERRTLWVADTRRRAERLDIPLG